MTLSTLTHQYLRIVSAKTHSAEWHDNATRVLTHEVLPRFGGLLPEELRPRQVAVLIAGIVEDGKPAKANHTLIALRNVYRWGFQSGRLDCANPCRDIARQPLKPRERVLKLDELRALWYLAGHMADYGRIVRLLMLTGARRQEIGGLMWPEVNLEARQIELPSHRVKNRRRFILPLSELALAQLPPARHGYPNLFGGTRGRGFGGWSKCRGLACAALPFRWSAHDLRRSFVTHCNELGLAEPHVIEACVNHIGGAKAGIAGVYNRAAYAGPKRALMERWADHLGQIIQGGVHGEDALQIAAARARAGQDAVKAALPPVG